MMTKKLPVGIESFEEIRKQDFYYVDKTNLIADLLLAGARSTCLPVRGASEKRSI